MVFLMKNVELDFCFCKGSSIGMKAVFDSIVSTLVVQLDNIQLKLLTAALL